jgi:DNA-directed RNA polymerase alpha subunit
MKTTSLNIMNHSISELNFSSEFKEFAQLERLDTVSDCIIIGTKKLDQTEGFTKRMLLEYLNFLEDHGLERFMDEEA